MNFLFITYTLLGMIALALMHYRQFSTDGNHLLVLIFAGMIFSSVLNYTTLRWSSLVYSAFFVIAFIFYTPSMQMFIDRSQFRKLLIVVFYLYLVGLIAGQLHIYFDLFSPIPGLSGFVRGGFGTILEKNGFRYFSFSSEPSYAAFIVISVFYAILRLDRSKSGLFKGENLFMFGLLVYMVFMFKSAYGILLLGMMILDYVGVSAKMLVIMLLAIGGIVLLISSDYEIRAFNRVVSVFKEMDLNNPRTLFAIDFTAYYRVVPVLYYIEIFDLTNIDFLFGYGAGASRYFVVPEIYSAYQEGEFLGGFLPSFFYDFGIFGGLLGLMFLSKGIHRVFSFQTAALLLMMLNANFNTQLFWLIFLCFYMLEYYRNDEVRMKEQPESKLNAAG